MRPTSTTMAPRTMTPPDARYTTRPGRGREKRCPRQRTRDRRAADRRFGRSAGSVLRSSLRTGALFDARPAAVRPQDGRPGPGDGVRQHGRCLRRVILGAVGLARAEGPTAAAEMAPGGVPAPAPAPWHRRHGGHCRRTRQRPEAGSQAPARRSGYPMSLLIVIGLLGLLASVSPATIVVFILLLATTRPRLNAVAFLIGWSVSLIIVFAA